MHPSSVVKHALSTRIVSILTPPTLHSTTVADDALLFQALAAVLEGLPVRFINAADLSGHDDLVSHRLLPKQGLFHP